jgi:alpha/beta superfamily hydrolase
MLGYDPDGSSKSPGVVICHPHPQMGGSMDNNVVYALFDEFAERGYVSLAFNFRGAGRSGGRHEGGEGEIKDVEAALNYLKGFERTKGSGLGILGYSFGAWVGLQAATRLGEEVGCTGAVAPPLAMLSFDFLDAFQGPLFFVMGDQDGFSPVNMKETLMKGPGGIREGKVIPGADHFFWGREKAAASYLCDCFLRCLPLQGEGQA